MSARHHHTSTWGYATTEINVYELIKISSMTLYYNFATCIRHLYIQCTMMCECARCADRVGMHRTWADGGDDGSIFLLFGYGNLVL